MAAEQRIDTMKRIVEATRELLNEQDKPSSRMIADRVGVTSPIIFHYFGDMEMLALVASYDIVAEYDSKIMHIDYLNNSSLESFRQVWETYADYSSKYPNVFHSLYFGKHGEDINRIKDIYHEIYPEEDMVNDDNKFSPFYHGSDLITRQKELLVPLLGEVDSVTSENVDTIAEIHASIIRYVLEYSIANSEEDTRIAADKLLNLIYFSTGIITK